MGKITKLPANRLLFSGSWLFSTLAAVLAFAPAKINLGLRVGALRADGYHAVETVLYPVPWFDAVEAVTADAFAFRSYGQPCGPPEENLCVKAWRLFQQHTGCRPVHLFLLKNLPLGAGLGGGSSDAVATLRVLQALFPDGVSDELMVHWAEQLGSDCPFFLKGRPVLATGRGEVLEPLALDLSAYVLTIAVPDVQVSTAWAYAAWDQQSAATHPEAKLSELIRLQVSEWRHHLYNDFESVVFTRFPHLSTLKQALYESGAVYASLSGSGSAVYGLFEHRPESLPALPFVHRWWTGSLGPVP
ncbi:MAG: 4-(cytidine 5'-diphospho)-2-C-methyl-D-erythritol kinase [Chitinophagales bacterium]|nr:4-(cytidine 5'-diphospho)-2-C-methyl-D-erythritol kinase [Chitinophagales bacterium]MDW8393542.1 4-(cytidine 5'-diphospho)-2-C-methyl-D-erythritol kinase [Chitinophagales bacterium]